MDLMPAPVMASLDEETGEVTLCFYDLPDQASQTSHKMICVKLSDAVVTDL